MDIIKECCKINNIKLPDLNKNIKYNDLFNIFNSTYSIFLTNKFFRKYSIRYKLILRYFKAYDIIYMNYDHKNDIINIIDIINQIILIYIKFADLIKDNKEKANLFYELYSKSNLNELNDYEKNLLTYKLTNDLIARYKIKKLKKIYFLDNNIEPLTLYKKICFSKEEIFFSFEIYIIKSREYKLRTFCQIAEKLGAVHINMKSVVNNKNSYTVNASISINDVENGIETKKNIERNNEINLSFKYLNYKSNLILNKYYINQLVSEESEFMITKDEFFSDIDFKFLIDSRCINLIDEYHTKLVINNINELERKIYTKVKGYGISCNFNMSSDNTDMVDITVKFIDIYNKDNLDCITGNNVYVMKEGFWHLKNIISLSLIENKNLNEISLYSKIDKFFETQLYYISRKDCMVLGNYNEDILKIYNDIAKINFKNNNEWLSLIYDFFKDNLIYEQYKKFREILINSYTSEEIIFKNTDTELIHKYYFICEQYHEAIKLNNILLSEIKKFIKKEFKIYTSNTLYKLIYDKLKNNTEFINNICDDPVYNISETIKSEENKFIEIIYDAFNFYINKYGFRYYGNKHIILNEKIITNSKKKILPNYIKNIVNTILYEIEQILYSNFDDKFSEIIMKIKINLLKFKNFNNNNINESFIKELLKSTLKKIILGMIQIYDSESEFKLRKSMIEDKLVKLIIQYYKYKNYDERVIKYLLNYKNHSSYEKEKYLNNITNEQTNINYINYKIYYTWKDFKYICETYYEEKLNEINTSYEKNIIDDKISIDDKDNIILDDKFLNDQQIENFEEQNKNLENIAYILNIKDIDENIKIIEKTNIIRKRNKFNKFNILQKEVINKNESNDNKLPAELIRQITECKKYDIDNKLT